MKRFSIVAVAAVFAVAMAGCSSSSSTTASAGGSTESSSMSGATVNATEKDFAIGLDKSSTTSGGVTFAITNQGPSTHEFVVFKTDLPADKLPVKNGAVNEDSKQLDHIDEQEDIAPGSTSNLSVTLDPGSYVVICNLPGHYLQGMYAPLTVS